MRIVIVSNITNGIGLQKDYELLRDHLVSLGHTVKGQQYDQPATTERFDLAIFIETISDHLAALAPRAWYYANPEWLKPEYVRPIQRHCERVLVKARVAEQSLRKKFQNVTYTGFLTADKRDQSIEKQSKFLHIGGNSGHRGTNAVLSAWREFRYWDDTVLMELVVVSNSRTVSFSDQIPGVTFIRRATDEQITQLQNECLYHLQPSEYEGFGHAIHESQSVGAVLLTTAAAPMTDLHAPFEIAPARERKCNFATLYEVSPVAIREAVERMQSLPNYDIARMQLEARMRFEQGNKEFAERFDPLLSQQSHKTSESSSRIDVPRAPADKWVEKAGATLRIAMLGNFHPPHSTENDLLWTLRDMGHHVIPFQENEDTTEQILEGCKDVQLLLYINTHGWVTPGKCTLDCLWSKLKDQGTITASFHLDRYWGLNANDHREQRIGSHPFWHVDKVFTADGGNQSRFSERGVCHIWLPPGVVKRDCIQGQLREDLAIDVGFVGAESYHPEYPFRGELLHFLRNAYGDRFRIFNGYRGERLNELYASIGVVVGDSCFGGSDYYWSDRVPETIGRGGYLIHPACRGLQIPGLVDFTPGDLHELQDKIDFSLAHPEFREHCRAAAFEWVRANETYTQRMTTLLRTVGLA